ncbi:MAG TPA: TGS domain-containing protein, partial [Kofleriaceae bacterium]|nr:TGS domain-containing protein [Kofleriaceae bacterium]
KYKEGRSGVADAADAKFAWLRQMMESQKDLKDPTAFMESVKIDLFGDEVYVFTPQGDVKALGKGSCPIDLAYAIHTSIGDHCSGARVNGVIVPLRYQLRNGDTVEIITSPNQKPNKDWLKLVKSARARTKIRHRLHREQRERAMELGREMLEKALRRYGVSFAKALKGGELETVAKGLKCHGVDDLICQVGYGKITATQVGEAMVPADKRKGAAPKAEETKNPLRDILRKVTRRRSASGIRVQGEADVLVRAARCCSALPGDDIVGFITRGRGVTVHRRDCAKALDLDPDRRVEVEWDANQSGEHEVTIQVLCADKPGLLAHISQSFSDAGVNISQAHCRTTEDGRAVNTFAARVHDLDQLKNVMRGLGRIKGVFSVDRVAETQSNT